MSTETPSEVRRDLPSGLTIFVIVVAVILALLAFWTLFVEAFAFGAPPGMPPQHHILDVPLVHNIDDWFVRNVPFLGGWGSRLLQWTPQDVWRYWILWFGIIMIGTCLVMLTVKRFTEPTNDEATVMHLKGDTSVAFRAKGFRG